ncbi:hypothetical protein IV203_010274 [Nitzschia inconspicua]|uniref:Uncharacterized protein n=1 Tax=Nitzschia inconspicua TaxID=303405 RepID=A0A9K3KVS1_9STRA|nr:hypothetical protein IV203_010274 [Nitzschia inconspicua]
MLPAKYHGLAAKEQWSLNLSWPPLKPDFVLSLVALKAQSLLPQQQRTRAGHSNPLPMRSWTASQAGGTHIFQKQRHGRLRDYSNGEVINIEGMDFLSHQPESWLSIQEDNNTLVTQVKDLHELTWVQKKVAVKGVPLPEIRRTVQVEIQLLGANIKPR